MGHGIWEGEIRGQERIKDREERKSHVGREKERRKMESRDWEECLCIFVYMYSM